MDGDDAGHADDEDNGDGEDYGEEDDETNGDLEDKDDQGMTVVLIPDHFCSVNLSMSSVFHNTCHFLFDIY